MTSYAHIHEDVSPAQIAAYLGAHGWEPVERRAESVRWTLAEAAGRARSVVLVRDPDDPDYEDFTTVLLARLRDVERRDTDAILHDILVAGRDTLMLRVAAPAVASGEVAVAYGTELFGGVRDLLVASGRSLAKTRANFAGPTPDVVMDLLKRMTFGETKRGSYTLTVRTPVDQQLVFSDEPATLALERQTIARTMEAVAAAQTAGAQLEDEDVVDESIEHGLSAQLCKALSRIDPATTGVRVDLSAEWAAGLPVPAMDVPKSVALHSADFAHLRYLGETLGKIMPVEEFPLNGWIKKIEYNALWESRGTVTVEGRVKGRRRDIRLELEGRDFEEAHRLTGHGHVLACGTLEKAGRAWVLTNPVSLSFSEGTLPLSK
jgi:hypothetical protein